MQIIALLTAAFILLSQRTRAEEPASSMWSRSAMHPVELSGLKCWTGKPVAVVSQVSWGTRILTPAGTPEMMYTHFFPSLGRFPGGNLIAVHCMEADSLDDPFNLNGFLISRNGGATWGRRYNLIMAHNCMIFLPDGGDSLLMFPSEMLQQSVGDDRNFVGPWTRLEDGGARLTIEPEGFRILGWPWAVGIRPQPQPRLNWHNGPTVLGGALRVGQRILATAVTARPENDYAYTTVVLIASDDDGHTWRYFSPVAEPDPSLEGQPGYEGPCEPDILRLADGSLMAIFRVGSGARWHLRRSYSRDNGRTWTRPDVLPAFSVMPSIVRTKNGLLAISSGRPGLGLWISDDPRGDHWQMIDIVAQHNAWFSDPSYRISARRWSDPAAYSANPLYPRPPGAINPQGALRWETTSYTHLVEVASDRLLMIYDRDAVIRPPDRPPASLNDVSRVFVMPIEIERAK